MIRRLVVAAVMIASCTKPPPPPPSPEELKAEADGHYVAATSAYLKGDFTTAHLEFDEVKRLAPNDPRLPAAQAELLLSEGKLDDAQALFEAATRAEPKRATNYARLGYIYGAKGQTEKALEVLNKALAINARDYSAYESRAQIEQKAGQVDLAAKDLLSACEASPEKAQGGYLMSAVKVLLEAGKKAEALEAIQAAVARGVKSAEASEQLGALLVETGKIPEAVSAYTAAAQLSPKDPTLWEIVGELEFKQGHLKEAESAYKRSLEIKDRGVVHVAIARMCKAHKMPECVKIELDKALATASGEEVREVIDLADLLAGEGRGKDALLLLKQTSEEPDQAGNLELQLKVAGLAKGVKDVPAMTAACARALKVGKPGMNCPR